MYCQHWQGSQEKKEKERGVKVNVHRVTAARIQVEPAKSKAAVARLSTLVDAPTLDGVDPAADERLVSLGDKIKEGPVEDLCRG